MLFQVAERLGHSISEVESWSYNIYVEWLIYFKQLDDLQKVEDEKAKGNLLATGNPDDVLKGFGLGSS